MIEQIKNIGLIEWSLITSIAFIGIWLSNPYLAKLLTGILTSIFCAILLLSAIADWIDPSKISSKYYKVLGLLTVIPWLIFVLFSKILNF